MAEIKSTLELINEKLGKLEVTPEEKARYRRVKAEETAKSLYNQYCLRNDPRDLNVLEEKLERSEPLVQEAFIKHIISNFSLEKPLPSVLQALKSLFGDEARGITETLQKLATSYQREKEEARHELEREIREELAQIAISGDAVRPNLAASPRWSQVLGTLDANYKKRLQKTFAQLHATSEETSSPQST